MRRNRDSDEITVAEPWLGGAHYRLVEEMARTWRGRAVLSRFQLRRFEARFSSVQRASPQREVRRK